jgi:membrane-bound lytic murein transglycosylase D
LVSPALGAGQPSIIPPDRPPSGETVSREIPRPAELQRDVDFWIRVYSEITTLQGVMHDERHLGVVYETLDLALAGPPGSSQRRELIKRARDRWIAGLDAAVHALEAGSTDSVTGDARRVLQLWGKDATPARLREARAEVRFQLGQADRFRAGIVRSGTWEPHIARTFNSLGLPPELAALPHVESSFTPSAYSKVGASGLWQFMRSTGRLYMRVDDIVDERLDPFRSTEAAARLLLSNYRLLGSWPLAITAYNHGPGGMRRARQVMGTDDFGVIARKYRSRTFGFASRNFYPSFLAALTIDQDPQRYFPGVTRAPEMQFHEISMPGYADIKRLEKALDVPIGQLRELNPALRPAVWSGERLVPRGYRLRLPPERPISSDEFVARVGADQIYVAQIGPQAHKIGRGENLHQIARKYGLNVRRVAELNGLDPAAKLKHGRVLKLPGDRPSTLADLAVQTPAPTVDSSL